MKVWTIVLLLGVLSSALLVQSQQKVGYSQVLTHLGNFQTANGGFYGAGSQDNIEASASATLLASLYGLYSKINTVEATKFIASLENKDSGYANTVGASSDVEATREALVALARLGAKTANPSNTAAYLKGLVEKSSGLFSNSAGEQGSIEATANALQALEVLGELNQKWVTDLFGGIKDALRKSFNGDSFGTDLRTNYFSTIAASIVGFEFAHAKLAKFIVDLQSPQGLFYSDSAKLSTSLEATADAMLTLYLLDKATHQAGTFVESVNVDTLRAAVRYLPTDIVLAADAHAALAVTKAFREHFLYHTGSAPTIVEGTQYQPVIAVAARESNGASHGGFEVSSKHTFSGKDATQGKLVWNPESQAYFGNPFSSAGNFGPFESVYTLSMNVPGLGPLSFDIADTKQVGYGIVVSPKATIELSGRDVKEGEQVTVGTDFKFDVALSSQSEAKLTSGDFVLTFSVLDSSDVVLHEETIDGAGNTKALSFIYKLTSADVPAGKLSFRFDVAAKGGKVAHTTRTVAYSLTVAMIAANIAFDGKSSAVKVGETVKISVEPATFPDLRTPHTLNTKNSKGEDATASRHFFLDIKSLQGTLLRSIEGTSTKSSKYTFQVPVEATFDSFGVNALSFRYKTASGEDVVLQNFDSSIGELFEDVNVLNYTVSADLSLVDVAEQPKAKDLVYGDVVVFKFKVKDAASGKNIVASGNSPANVYLELQHEDASRTFSSVNVPAVSTADGYVVANWTINPNAHKGDGVLTLSVVDADGKKIPLKNSISHKVSIGGEITFQPHVTSTGAWDTTASALIVEMGMFCNGKSLEGAQLRAQIHYEDKNQLVATLPVAHNNGRYTVSYSAAHRDIKSGSYKVSFFREVDRLIALEQRDQRDKKARKERQLKGETVEAEVNVEDVVVDPIFTVTIPHTAPRLTQLPVKAEFIALVLFGGIVFWLINKRSNLK